MKDQPIIKIGNRYIGGNNPVFIIAEAGANHNGDLLIAKELVKEAKKAGADCIKFQTFTAEEFCADKSKQFTYSSQGKKVTESEFEMFKRLEFTVDQWSELIRFCNEQEISFLTTVQDPINLKMLIELKINAIKVGSDDFDHLVNLKHYVDSNLPLIMSKGMADLEEVDRVINAIQKKAFGRLAVLHCVSLYPADANFLNLSQIKTLSERYPNIVWGFSDHSISTITPALAVMMGAKIIEKHFTLDKNLPGPDHWFSVDPKGLCAMVEHIRYAESSIGDGKVFLSAEEKNAKMHMRRRLIAKRQINVGEPLSDKNVMFKRATSGIFAGEWGSIKGARLKAPKSKGECIEIDDLLT